MTVRSGTAPPNGRDRERATSAHRRRTAAAAVGGRTCRVLGCIPGIWTSQRPSGTRTPRDVKFLRRMLVEAWLWDPYTPRPDYEQHSMEDRRNPYVFAFGRRPGDAGFVATEHGRRVGAAWYRTAGGPPRCTSLRFLMARTLRSRDTLSMLWSSRQWLGWHS